MILRLILNLIYLMITHSSYEYLIFNGDAKCQVANMVTKLIWLAAVLNVADTITM